VLLKEAKTFRKVVLQRVSPVRHSRLYYLPPVGVGTQHVESMTSYLSRLAVAHCWHTNTLLALMLVPVINKPYMCGGRKHWDAGGSTLSRISTGVKTINGMGSVAESFLIATESLTLRRDLSFLSFLALKEVLPTRHLLRPYKAWCPECYAEWRAARETVYDPLLWVVEAVQVCELHERRLLTRCPHCEGRVPFLSRHARPGYCSVCRNWLGSGGKGLRPRACQVSIGELRWQAWVAENVGELLASSPTLEAQLSGENVVLSLAGCIRRAKDGSLTQFSSLIGKRKNTVWGWQHGQNRPTLIDLLHICSRAECSLLNFLTANESVVNSDAPLKAPYLILAPAEAPRRERLFDHSAVRQKLQSLLLEEQAISVREAARRVGHGVRSLYRCFPDLCKKISQRHSYLRRVRATKHQQKLREEVRGAVFQLHFTGRQPTGRNVEDYLKKPAYSCRRDVRAALREAVRLLESNYKRSHK
jgi:transcriptional regulator with XRE-family HTH domain